MKGTLTAILVQSIVWQSVDDLLKWFVTALGLGAKYMSPAVDAMQRPRLRAVVFHPVVAFAPPGGGVQYGAGPLLP